MTELRRALFAAALVLCVSESPHAATAPIALHYDATLAAAGFPSPLLSITIGGQRGVFLIDTGAGVHVIAKWFVEAAGLTATPTDMTVTGSTGTETRVDIVPEVSATIDGGRKVVLADAVVTAFPPVFETHRIAGLISPQLLAVDDEDAILDLRRPRLLFQRSKARAIASPTDRGRACTNAESPFRNRLYAINVVADGNQAELLLDTGATRTTLDASSAAARALEGRAVPGDSNQGVGGAIERLRRVPDVRLARGGSTAPIELRIGNVHSQCGAEGLLGMDALRQCVLTLGPSRVEVKCARTMH